MFSHLVTFDPYAVCPEMKKKKKRCLLQYVDLMLLALKFLIKILLMNTIILFQANVYLNNKY